MAARLNDPERLTALALSGVLDSAPEPAFDRFTRLASRLLGAPVVLLSAVDDHRQFFKSRVGLEITETALSHSFCQHVVTAEAPLIVSDAREDPLVSANLAIRDLGVIAYLGVPLTTSTGLTLGSFCAIDSQPRVWEAAERELLEDLAQGVVSELELRVRNRELAEREALLSGIIDHAPAGIMLRDAEGRYWRGNAYAAETLGITPQEIPGRAPEEFFTTEVAAQIRAHDVQVLAADAPVREELTTRRANGEIRTFDVVKYPIRGTDGELVGLGSFSLDVTERREAAALLRRTREHAETIIASMREGYALTVSGQITEVNDALCELTGFAREQLIGAGMPFPFWPTDQLDESRSIRDRVVGAGGGTFEITLMRRDRSTFDAEITAQPARQPDGTLIGFVNTIRDISERKRHEQEERALRRIAELVAENAGSSAVFAAAALEARQLFAAHTGIVTRFDETLGVGVQISGHRFDEQPFDATVFPLDGPCSSARVWRTRASVRFDRLADDLPDPALSSLTPAEVTGGVCAPVFVGGQLWGSIGVAFAGRRVPPDAEDRLARFARLTAMAIANAEAWDVLSRQASTDAMTGLANHRTFQERLRAEVTRAQRYQRNLSLVLLDVDHFKQVNDTHGHQVGDRVLAEVGRRLRDQARAGELVARIGGEEFAWLMPETDRNGALQAAERLRRTIESDPFPAVGTLTVSAGACSLEEGRNADELVRHADRALYWAKDNGRNTSLLYSAEAHARLSGRSHKADRFQAMSSVRALARAIDSKHPGTREHSERVAALAEQIALGLGWTAKRARLLHACGLLHDVGKIGIPDEILLKPGALTPEEYEEIKQHAELSARIASEVLEDEQVTWIRGHHERWDGSGYPDGLAGLEIPDGAQILAVADAYDVMTESRTYRPRRSPAEALIECRAQAGRQFAPGVVASLGTLTDTDVAA